MARPNLRWLYRWLCLAGRLAGHSTTSLTTPTTQCFDANWNNGELGQQGFRSNMNPDEGGGEAQVHPTSTAPLSFTWVPLIGGWAYGLYDGDAIGLLAPAASALPVCSASGSASFQ